MLTVDDLTYDEATHVTTAPDGTQVPHVTAILSEVGMTTDFAALSGMHPRMLANIEMARAVGTAVHADCHAYDDDALDLDAVDRRVRGYVEAWAVMRRNMGLVPVTRERRLFHPFLHYTGIMDGVFAHPDGRHILADIKTGDPESSAAHLQTAAYEEAYVLTCGGRVDERWAVWLRPGQVVPYKIKNYSARPDAHTDIGVFAACVTVYANLPHRRKRT